MTLICYICVNASQQDTTDNKQSLHSTNTSDRTVLLRKCPRKRFNAIRHPLKLILLLACNLFHHIRRTVVITIAPLDFRRVEIDLHICAVHILRCAGGEAAQGGD